MIMTELAISAAGLTKRYGDTLALDRLDLDVTPGEVFGFLGPNGAGKSTAIRVFIGALRANSGTVKIFGRDPFTADASWRHELGYLPGELVLPQSATAERYLNYLARLRSGRGVDQIRSLASRLRLDVTKPMRSLSKGNKQKVGVIQAFMHQPKLLILDEPTSGLDPLLQHEVASMIAEAQQRGATTFFSSHVLSEVEATCSRVAIIRQGQLVTVDLVARLREIAGQTLRVTFDADVPTNLLAGIDAVTDVTVDRNTLRAVVHGNIGDVLAKVAALSVTDMQLVDRELDDLFLAYYRDAPAGDTNE